MTPQFIEGSCSEPVHTFEEAKALKARMAQPVAGVFLWSFIDEARQNFTKPGYVYLNASRRFIIDEIVYNLILGYPQFATHEVFQDPIFIAYCKEQDRQDGDVQYLARVLDLAGVRNLLTEDECLAALRKDGLQGVADAVRDMSPMAANYLESVKDRKPAGTPAPEFDKTVITPVEYVVWEDGIEVEEQDTKEERTRISAYAGTDKPGSIVKQ